MLQAALNAFKLPDLRRKLLFTLGVLVIYRFAASIPVPGIDQAAFNNLLKTYKIFQLLSLFSGGSGGFSIVSLGVYPYITAQIAIQILLPVIPRLEELSREGEAGRTKLNQITRLATIPLAMLQAYGQGVLISNSTTLLKNFGFFGGNAWTTLGFMLVMTTGTLFLIWLGELITESGVGNGVSLIIFAGIIARLPSLVSEQLQANNLTLLVGISIVAVLVIAAIVFVQEAQRRIPVQYARRVVRGRMTQAQSTHIPLRVNSAGMIPLIFAFSIVTTPAIIASYFEPSNNTIVRNAATWIVNTFNQDNCDLLGVHLHPGIRLYLLLHDGAVAAAAALGESAEEWRLHSRLPPRQAHRGLPEPRAQPDHTGRRPIPGRHRHHAVSRPSLHLRQYFHP